MLQTNYHMSTNQSFSITIIKMIFLYLKMLLIEKKCIIKLIHSLLLKSKKIHEREDLPHHTPTYHSTASNN